MCSDKPSRPIDKDCSLLYPLAFILHNKDGIQTCQVSEMGLGSRATKEVRGASRESYFNTDTIFVIVW